VASEKKPGRLKRKISQARKRSELVDHLFRTKERYSEAFGSRLAAACAYYGFFAVFALGVVGFAVLGFLMDSQPELRQRVTDYLAQNLPVIDPAQISAGSGTAGVFGLIGLVVTGLAWVDGVRSSQRRIWHREQEPGNLVKRRLVDVLTLLILAAALGLSLGASVVVGWLLGQLPLAGIGGWIVLVGVNLVLVVGLMAVLPRLRISWRRLLAPALVVAVGLVVLNTVGQFYFTRTQQNPAYAVVATAAGLLVYLYVVHQLLFWATAWVATSDRGRVVDLATGGTVVHE
jgi:membrane protein